MSKTIKCTRCNRRYRNQGDWNVEMKAGVPQCYLCPGCQTPEQNTEAVINESTLDYRRVAGVVTATAKANQ